jgi:hypothetical protein
MAVTLRQLEYLVAVVDHGSFTRAAELLHVTQPGLSQQLRALEREDSTRPANDHKWRRQAGPPFNSRVLRSIPKRPTAKRNYALTCANAC